MLKNTAINYLKTFFSSVTGDEVKLNDIFSAANRNLQEEVKNKTWLGNKTVYMKRYEFIEPIYEKKGHIKILTGLRLKNEGKIALGRIQGTLITDNRSKGEKKSNSGANHKITLSEIVDAMPRIRKENPEFIINFEAKLRQDG